jgi:hypothetical protein
MIMMLDRIHDEDNPLDFNCIPQGFNEAIGYLAEEIEYIENCKKHYLAAIQIKSYL